jgi:DNA replication protein DnaC
MFSLLNTIQELGSTVALVSLPKLVQRLKNNFGSNQNYLNEQMINNLEKIDFLVLDDIGAEQTDSWFYNQFLFDLLDFRYVNKKVTFFTSNYQLNQLLSKWKSSTSMTKIDITRIIERIKALTNNCSVQLKDVNYRYSNQIIKS